MKKFLSDDALSWKTEVGRNTFDISKKHFASYNFGKIYPMYLRHVQPNESIKIRPHMELELEPLNHELYNDIKCNTAYFFVRTRSLWSSWRKYVRQDPTKDSSIVHPFIAQDNWLSVGSLGNHLGIPVNSYGVFDSNAQTSFTPNPDALGSVSRGGFANNRLGFDSFTDENFSLDMVQPWVRRDFSNLQSTSVGIPCFGSVKFNASLSSSNVVPAKTYIEFSNGQNVYQNLGPQLSQDFTSDDYHTHGIVIGAGVNTLVSDDFHLILPHIRLSSFTTSTSPTITDYSFKDNLVVYCYAGSSIWDASFIAETSLGNSDSTTQGSYVVENVVSHSFSSPLYNAASTTGVSYYPMNSGYFYTEDFNLYFDSTFTTSVQEAQQKYSNVFFVILPESYDYSTLDSLTNTFSSHSTTAGSFVYNSETQLKYVVAGFYGFPKFSSQNEVNTLEYSPFEGVTPDLPLSVLPFRAYRNIYNSHFRDLIHDPLRDSNGDIMTDQYVENMGDGADTTTSLDFEYCRFEPDLFNTCLPSPTMGDDVNRPLVGITASSDPDTYTLNYNSDGLAYTIDVHANSSDGTITDMVGTTHSEGANNLTYLTLKDAINYGISLQDLQNVRALTKWYEASYRGKGRFEYDKFVEAHFGKSPALKENLAAEYLGGETTFVNSFKVINQSADGVSPLGAMAGLANFSAKEDPISCYCDEDGYIMGVVWFTCDNVNTQSIDKLWYLSQPGDYATPEFADLGVQPITMKEFLPLQTPLANANDVFGYQRIFGDKLYSFDSVAGDFLTDKASYLMQRRYDGSESLTADFSKMKPEEFTNVFAFDNTLDKIYGKWYFDTTISTWLQQTPNVQII